MQEVESFYNTDPEYEWHRLERHRTEHAVTLRVLGDHLPAPPARVLDVGGGPGRYSIELAQRGYAVTLLDVSEGLLGKARALADEAGVTFEGIMRANALDMSALEDSSFDVALVMGPLYHLKEEGERRQALKEARRVLKPGGLLFASFVSRFAPLRYAAKYEPDWAFLRPGDIESLLTKGVFVSPPEGSGFAHIAYFSHPLEVEPLVRGAGFEPLELVGLEGVVSELEEGVNSLGGEEWDAWVELNYRLGREPALLGSAGHILCVARASKK